MKRLIAVRRRAGPRLLAPFLGCIPLLANASTCYGTVGNGRLANGMQLPVKGDNFLAYSAAGIGLGRTYVHSRVRQTMLDAYAEVGKSMPGKVFVYGETGFERGGRIRPHRTHQAGISVDFMVPVLDDANRSIRLPSSPLNKFGYGLEFDKQGRIPGYRVDVDAMAEHLYQISIASRRQGLAVERVILDPDLMKTMFRESRRGAELQRTLPFMKTRPWIRHDEHYHVDFRIPCRPLRDYPGK